MGMGMTDQLPTYHVIADPSESIREEDAHEAWFLATIPFLKGLASTYQGYTTDQRYAEYLFEQTGIGTTRASGSWSGQVLGRALGMCADRGWPALPSLVVDRDTGMCSAGLDGWHRSAGAEPADATGQEELAARLRVHCYRRYALDVPEDVVKFHTPLHLGWLTRQRRTAGKFLTY